MGELAAGASFAGYEIEGIAGRGGMGIVYRARQQRPARQVALKLVALEAGDDGQTRRRFERECELAASIDHPHIIPVYEVGECDGRLFIAMRFVGGTDLSATIRRDGPIAPGLAVTILGQVADALDAAHAAGLVHRDVKPANVLLSGDGVRPHAYLTDFGLGRNANSGSLTRSGDVVGTLDYVAPEMLHGDLVDTRADVYALGCVLFEMLAGRAPFAGDSAAAKVFAHLHQPPPAPSRASPTLGAFDQVVARALAKSPRARFATAGDLASAAVAALAGVKQWSQVTDVVPRAALTSTGGHVVITGETPTASRLVRAFADEGHVVIEAGALDGPARPEMLADWDIAEARHLIVTGEDPIANLGVARAAEEAVRDRSGTLGTLVQCEDLDLWRTLQAEAVSRIEHPHIRIDFFSVLALAADLILERHAPFAADAPHPCIVGAGGLAEPLVLGIARRRRLEVGGESPLPLTLTGPGAPSLADDLLDRFPELADLCDLRVLPAELRSSALRRGEVLAGDDGPAVSVVYVALDDPASTLTVAGALARPRGRPPIPVVATIAAGDSGPGELFGRTAGPLGGVTLFDVAAEALTPELVVGGPTEVLARAKHDQYLDAERRRGRADPDDPALADWADLPDSLKESNRRFADGIGRKLRSIGLRLAPSPLLPLGDSLLTLTDEEIEALAREEHDRWVRDLERDGWRATRGPRDPHRRLHPQLVPWEELAEDVRDKDREPVRELPRMLGRLGYELYRAAP